MSDTTDTDASPARIGPVLRPTRTGRAGPNGAAGRSPLVRAVVPSVVGILLIVGGIYSFDHTDRGAGCDPPGLAWARARPAVDTNGADCD